MLAFWFLFTVIIIIINISNYKSNVIKVYAYSSRFMLKWGHIQIQCIIIIYLKCSQNSFTFSLHRATLVSCLLYFLCYFLHDLPLKLLVMYLILRLYNFFLAKFLPFSFSFRFSNFSTLSSFISNARVKNRLKAGEDFLHSSLVIYRSFYPHLPCFFDNELYSASFSFS